MSDLRRRALMRAAAAAGNTYDLDDLIQHTEPSGDVVLSRATRIWDYAFYQNTAITSLSAPEVTKIGTYAFQDCTALRTISMPKLTVIGLPTLGTSTVAAGYVFRNCNALETIHLPKLETVMCNGLFYQIRYNQGLSNAQAVIVLPSIVTLGNMAFRQSALRAIDLGPGLTKIWNDTFYAGEYGVVILRSPTVVPAATRDSVRGITTLYAPAAIVADYAAAENWAADSANRTVLPIEGSEYEHYYADGTPIA